MDLKAIEIKLTKLGEVMGLAGNTLKLTTRTGQSNATLKI